MNRKIAVVGFATGIVLLGSQGATAEPPLGISGDVTVMNGESNPVPVTVQETGFTNQLFFFMDEHTINSLDDIVEVQAGSQLLVEHVSATVNAGPGVAVFCSIGVPANQEILNGPNINNAHIPFVMTYVGYDQWVGSQSVRIYSVDPADFGYETLSVRSDCGRFPADDVAHGEFQISGKIINGQ